MAAVYYFYYGISKYEFQKPSILILVHDNGPTKED
jgi:hypothetical protein